jgi:translation initiation factor 4E
MCAEVLIEAHNCVYTRTDRDSLVNNLVPPSKLLPNANYHFFKEGIEPKWEHPRNEKGGKWQVVWQRHSGKTDSAWLYSLLALIGESLDDESEEICGAVVSVRQKQEKVAIWTKTGDKPEAVQAMGQKIKALLDLGAQDKLEFSVCWARSNANIRRVAIAWF